MKKQILQGLGLLLALAAFAIDLTGGQFGDSRSGIAIPSARAGDKKRDRPVSRCVKYSQQQGEIEMSLSLKNRCERQFECSLQWDLACHRARGKSEKSRKSAVFYLAGASEHTVTASAAQCGDDGWSIRQVRWSCSDSAGEATSDR